MRRLLQTLPFLLAAAPLSAQTWLDHPPVFEVRLANDPSWHRATQVAVGECPAFALESDHEADGSFTARRFSAATAVRYTDRNGIAQMIPDSDLKALSGCGSRGPAIPPECGNDPAHGKELVLGMVARLKAGGRQGSDLEREIGSVTPDQIAPVNDAALCRQIMVTIAGIKPAPDTLPLLGVLRTGSAGYMTVRASNGPWSTIDIMDTDLVLRATLETRAP